MSKNIRSLGTNVFYDCKNLKNVYYYGQIKDWCEIEFGQDVSSPMYYRANFYLNNESNEWYIPEEIIIPNTISKLNAFAFYNFTFIKGVYFEENSIVTLIGEQAFKYCYNLIDLEIPETINKIDSKVFDYVDKLENVYYGGTIESWCTISFSSTYFNPMNYADHFCMKNEEDNWYEVTEIVIPNTITKIGDYQFYGFENMTSIKISNNVTSIGSCAFSTCTNLTDVYYTGTEEEWNAITIGSSNDCLTSATIHYNYVPSTEEE